MTANQEILPPQRDERGRFQPGSAGGPGRPDGALGVHSKTIRDMVREALEMVGGVNYLAMCAITQPQAFIGLVGKTMPLKLSTDGDGMVAIMVAKRVIVHEPKPND